MRQIMMNTIDGLCPTLMSGAFAEARVSYFLGCGKVWAYPAVMVITDETDSD